MAGIKETKRKEKEGMYSVIFVVAFGGFLTALSAIFLIQGFGLEWNFRVAVTCFGLLGFFGLVICVILGIAARDAKRERAGVSPRVK